MERRNVPGGVIVALALLCAGRAVADAAGDEIKALCGVIESNSVNRTTKCRYYKAWYSELCTKEELKAILDRNVAAHRRWKELDPGSFAPYAGLGRTLAAVGRWKDAKPELEKALSAPEGKLPGDIRINVLWEMANCLWQEGDRDGAKKCIAQIATIDWKGDDIVVRRRALYLHRAWTDRDADLDVFTLPHSTDRKPFPTPQESTYGEAKVSLARVELKTAGLKPDDPIARLIKRKLTRFGAKLVEGSGKWEEGRSEDAAIVRIAILPDAPVDKPQGYSLEVRSKKEEGKSEYGVVSIKARDRLGALWGVVSFLQCIQRKEPTDDNSKLIPSTFSLLPSICTLQIADWPKCLRRGVIDYWYDDFLEYAIFNRMSMANIRMDGDYVPSPLDRERYRLWCARFREFGIEMFCGSGNIMMNPMLPLSSPRTRKLHVGWARFVASIGGNFALHLDDCRFPMHPLDLENAGTAANLDAKYMTDIYREVKKDYPGFKMLFCPPFYWGPDGGVGYPEPRDQYLKSLGSDLDPEVEVYWTGPRVKSGGMSDEKTDWYAGLIGRKPVIFHNSDCRGRHNHIAYGADVPGYKASHSTNLFEHVSAFLHNMSRYQAAPAIGACMDWCWNPEAHDPETAVRRTDEMLVGPGVFEILRDATPALAYFDKYVYGSPRSELLTEDQADLDRRITESEAAWSKVMAIAKNNGLFVEDFNRCGIKWAKKLASNRRNPPQWLKERYDAEMANTALAEKEVGFDASKGDLFFPAETLMGGLYVKGVGEKGMRNVKYVSVGEELSGRFSCELFPPERPFKIIFMGFQWNRHAAFADVEVNGRKIWSGEVFANKHRFNAMEIEIPVDVMQRSNTFVFRNSAPMNEGHRKPEVHYVVIKK